MEEAGGQGSEQRQRAHRATEAGLQGERLLLHAPAQVTLHPGRQAEEERTRVPHLTEDGRPRYTENQYATTVAEYDDVFRSVGLNPALFKERYGELIRGEVMPDELEAYRIRPMYERIVEGSEAIRRYYSDRYGVEMNTQALLASAIDPEVGNKILNQQISLAEIGGEAAESGFDITPELVQRLYESGEVDRDRADKLFETAESFIPTLNVLTRRHADPDDEFDLEEFVNADIFADPNQRRRMRRLVAQEQALFSGSPALARSRTTGALSGLESL